MTEISSSISQRSVRSSWRSSTDGVGHGNGNAGGWSESSSERDGSRAAKRSSAWKRVTTLYTPSPRQTLAEDETLDLWDNNDSDFQREVAQEANQHSKRASHGMSAPTTNSSASCLTSESMATVPLPGPGYPSSNGHLPTASQPLRPASVTGVSLIHSPSTSAISSDRGSAFTLSSPSIGTDDGFERRRLSSSTRFGSEKGKRRSHTSAAQTDARSTTTSPHHSPPHPTVEILQEPWTIWSAERRPSPPEKERLQMEALDELIRSQLRRTSANTNSTVEAADAFGPVHASPTKTDKDELQRRRSMHDVSAKEGAALGGSSSTRSSKRRDRPTMLKTGKQQGCAIDPWSEMTPFGMIIQRPSPNSASESASTPRSAESRSSRSGRSFREQQEEAQATLQRERAKPKGSHSTYRVSVVEHLTYDQARQMGLEGAITIPTQIPDTSMRPPPRPNRPEENLQKERARTSRSTGDAQVLQIGSPLPPFSSASASDLQLTRSRSEAAESRKSAAAQCHSSGSATWTKESGGSSGRTSHSSTVATPSQQYGTYESGISAPGVGTSAKGKQAGKLGKLSKFLSGKNALALLRRPQAPDDDEDFTQMAVDPFAHRTVIPYSTRSSSTIGDVSLSKQMSATSLQPARGQSFSSMTARSPYVQPSNPRHWRSSNHLAEERTEHDPSTSSTSLSASHNKRPNFGIQLQPDAAAAFDSIPLPDTPERSLSRASSVKVSLGSPQPAEYAQRKGSFSLPSGWANNRPSHDDEAYEVNSALSHDRSTAGLPDDLPADVDEFDDFLEEQGRADLRIGEPHAASAADDVEILDDGGETDGFGGTSPSSSSAVATPVSSTKTEADQPGQVFGDSPSSRSQRPALTSSLESYIFPTRAKSLADDVRHSWHLDSDPGHEDRLSPPSSHQPPPSISPRTSVIAPHLRRPSSSSSFV